MEHCWPSRDRSNLPVAPLQSISQMLNLAPKSKYKGGTVPRWPKSAARLPGPAGELAGSVCFMENQRLQECWPGRRRWKGKAFVPCTRAWEIPEREWGPESCS